MMRFLKRLTRLFLADFFGAFQPVHSTRSYDTTTRRPKTQTKITRHDIRSDVTTKSPAFYHIEDTDSNKQKKIGAVVFDYYTTVKPDRKTTKSAINNYTTRNSGNKSDRSSILNRTNHRDVDVTGIDLPKVRRPDGNQFQDVNNNRYPYDTEKNTIVNYDTVRPIVSNRRPYTQTPYTSRPGVRPAVVNGPPITNKPPTRRPNVGISRQDDTISPELIIGPNEEFMSNVEKKRYIEMSEKSECFCNLCFNNGKTALLT